MVALAKAEVEENPNASRAIRRMAGVKENDAESALHTIFAEYGLVPNVEISTVDLGHPQLTMFPVINLSSWMQCLLDSGMLWRQMTGTPTFAKMKEVLSVFWERFQAAFPEHGVFELSRNNTLQLDQTIPFFSHTDEGRSLKHLPIWILSSHGALGRGTKKFLVSKKHVAPLHRHGLGMNFLGSTWATQFVFATMLRSVSEAYPGSLDKLIRFYSEDVRRLALEGLTARNGGYRVWFIQIGTKGDLPALSRIGSLKRNFSHAPKAKASKKPCKGICHLCLAGREVIVPNVGNRSVYPYEEFSQTPKWLPTVGVEDPWETEPEILHGAFMGNLPKPSFLCIDLWHTFHLGLAKRWVGASLASLAESNVVPGNSIEAKLGWVTERYKEFGVNSWVKHINRDTLNWPQSSAVPTGKWNKGSVSTHLMGFLEWLMTAYVIDNTTDPLLLAIDSRIETNEDVF